MRTMVQWFRTEVNNQLTAEAAVSRHFTEKSSTRLAGLRVTGVVTLLLLMISSFATAQEDKVFKMALVRYNLNGSLDGSFGGTGKVIIDFPTSTSEKAYGMCFDDEGKIMSVGSASGQFALTLYHTNGTIDGVFGNNGRVLTSFPGFDAKAYAVAVQADGKYVVVGKARKLSDDDYYFAVARYNSLGGLDNTFDGDGKILTNFSTSTELESAHAVAIQPNGKIVVAGDAYANGHQFALLRYNPNGSLDTAFDGDGKVLTNFTASADESAYAMKLQNDGKIVAAGSAVIDGSEQFALARYNSNGKLDASFDGDGKVITNFFSGPSEAINDIAIQGDGKIVAAGSASANGSSSQFQFALARYNTNGSLDATFDKDGRVVTNFAAATSESINGVALQDNGRIAAGGFAYINGHFQFAVARYNSNGSLDASFDGDGKLVTNFASTDEEFANAIAIQSDGKIVVAGEAVNAAAGKSVAEDEAILLPETYSLSQNNPNPFNPTTTIQFALKESGWTTLKIYNAVGQEVAVLVDGNLEAGQHTFNFNAADLPSGIYFYQVSVNDFRAVKKMQLVK